MSATITLAVSAALVGWAYLQRRKGYTKPQGEHRDPWTEPIPVPATDEELARVQNLACTCAASLPVASDGDLVACVWAAMHPDIPWPLVNGDDPTLEQVAQLIAVAVIEAQGGVCPASTPARDNFDNRISATPWPGHHYQAVFGDTLMGNEGIVARAIYRATLDAALARGDDAAAAEVLAAANAADAQNRIAYLHAIQCSPWNDALYGTYGYGETAWASSHGRAIRLLPQHYAIYDLIRDLRSPVRSIALGKPEDAKQGTATGPGNVLEFLWLPDLDPLALLDADRQVQVSTINLVWDDGTPRTLPPPAVQALGIVDAPAISWGCQG